MMKSSVQFGLRKRQKVDAPPQAFSDESDEESIPQLSEENVNAKVKQLQEEGSRHAEDGQYSAAIRTWDRALSMRPTSAVLHELKAQVLLDAGQPWAAIQSAMKATSLDSSWAEGFLTLSRAQFNYGEPEEALNSINEVLRLKVIPHALIVLFSDFFRFCLCCHFILDIGSLYHRVPDPAF
ncbi:probable tetratricopeptide repeat protein 33 [Coccomyxa sp. Obi]|nr:probable tetratricopeptide repeat protein 33 [Coccomyxa sp. Obi]